MSWNKFYIISIQDVEVWKTFDTANFHKQLTTANGVLSWWHYLNSTYIIKVPNNITAQNVTEYVMRIAPNRHFFTCEIDLNDYNGFLPQDAWDWIERNK